MNQTETRKIRVYGIVQGVGFRGDFCTGDESTGGWLP